MNIYANANKVPEENQGYLTEGKDYLVDHEFEDGRFMIYDDNDVLSVFPWSKCADIGYQDWERIEKAGVAG